MAKEIGLLLTAMITAFKADGSIDFAAAERLANLLVADGSDGVVVAGTTGESPTLSDDEKIELVRMVREAIPGRGVVAGTGTYDTRHSVHLSEPAMAAGAEPVLLVATHFYQTPPCGIV